MAELTKILNTGMLDMATRSIPVLMQICYCKRHTVWQDMDIYAMKLFRKIMHF